MNKIFFALLCVFAITANAQTPVSQFEKDTQLLYNQFYRPLLMRVVVCLPNKYPTAAAMEACAKEAASQGYRFPSPKEANAEAMESAKLHAGLLKRNGWKIVDDAATDPWTSWRCLPPTCNMGTNEEIVAKSTVRTYVVDADGKVFDHRMRYFIRPDWAKTLGKINPRFSVTQWNKQAASINAALAAQAPK